LAIRHELWGSSTDEDENLIIKVKGQARVIIGGAKIHCTDGGVIGIKRNSRPRRAGRQRSNPYHSDSDSRITLPSTHSTMSSQDLSLQTSSSIGSRDINPGGLPEPLFPNSGYYDDGCASTEQGKVFRRRQKGAEDATDSIDMMPPPPRAGILRPK
jgi:hypothetical protein